MRPVEAVFEEVLSKMKKYASWSIICHENPDGDTLGSSFALCSLGLREGKKVSVLSKSMLPDVFSFFPHYGEAVVGECADPQKAAGSLLIVVDTSTEGRALTNLKELLSSCADSVNIDHHKDNTMFAASNLVVPGASAAAEIVTRLMEAYGSGITKEEASALYTALTTDNGSFRFNSTSVESHRCAQVLLAAGADPAAIDDRINENMTCGILRLWGKALSRTEVFADGRCAFFCLREKEISDAGAVPNSLDGLVNMLLRIRGVKAALFLAEIDGRNKLSVRSRAPYSAREIAAVFGGGGHDGAAGARIGGDFNSAAARVKEEAEKYARSRDSAGK
ncbi:MAG: DHH family phosphoesterase [Synergistes sp.]|nr:DHH family phosphoesterase [Synergistes sp.]